MDLFWSEELRALEEGVRKSVIGRADESADWNDQVVSVLGWSPDMNCLALVQTHS